MVIPRSSCDFVYRIINMLLLKQNIFYFSFSFLSQHLFLSPPTHSRSLKLLTLSFFHIFPPLHSFPSRSMSQRLVKLIVISDFVSLFRVSINSLTLSLLLLFHRAARGVSSASGNFRPPSRSARTFL